MKKSNKGFFLAETIVMVALITTVMAFVYPNVAKLYENYKYRTLYYDQPEDLYYLKAYLKRKNYDFDFFENKSFMRVSSEGEKPEVYIAKYMETPSDNDYNFNKYLHRLKRTTYDQNSYRLIGKFKNTDESYRYASIKVDTQNLLEQKLSDFSSLDVGASKPLPSNVQCTSSNNSILSVSNNNKIIANQIGTSTAKAILTCFYAAGGGKSLSFTKEVTIKNSPIKFKQSSNKVLKSSLVPVVSGVELAGPSASMQSFAFIGNYVYMSNSPVKNDTYSRLTKYEKSSGKKSYAYINHFGHMGNFDFDNNNNNIWTDCGDDEHKLCRYPLASIVFETEKRNNNNLDLSNLKPKYITGKENVSHLPALDVQNNKLVLQTGTTKKQEFLVYNLSDFSSKWDAYNNILPLPANDQNFLNSFSRKDYNGLVCTGDAPDTSANTSFVSNGVLNNANKDDVRLNRQGLAVSNGYIYLLEGHTIAPNAYISVYTLEGEEKVERLPVEFPDSTTSNGLKIHWEPEGIKVYDGHIYIGFSRLTYREDANYPTWECGKPKKIATCENGNAPSTGCPGKKSYIYKIENEGE